jgi:hypothetical protein
MKMNKVLIICLSMVILFGCAAKDWRTASRESAGIAPNPITTKDAVLQVYGAPVWGWRGWFAIHTCYSRKCQLSLVLSVSYKRRFENLPA